MCIEQNVDSDVPNEDQGVVTSDSHFYRWLLPVKQAAWTRSNLLLCSSFLLLEELTKTYA